MVAALVEGTQTDRPLIVLVGATASGKSSLAIYLAEAFDGEVVSCDSVAVYREMEIGTAKPSFEERQRVPHHMIDVVSPDEACTAGDYSRGAREALAGIRERNRLPIVAGGTGLYLRALIEGLFPAPPQQPELREALRRQAKEQGPSYLHNRLAELDPAAARAIHANDVSKVIRAIEVSLAAQQSLTKQWQKGRDALTGYRILKIGLDPGRERLYDRINQRASAMFDRGLVEETERLVERYGHDCRPLTSLGYAQALSMLRGECTREEAVSKVQQGHRNYAKRQATWFRRDKDIPWFRGAGTDGDLVEAAVGIVEEWTTSRQ